MVLQIQKSGRGIGEHTQHNVERIMSIPCPKRRPRNILGLGPELLISRFSSIFEYTLDPWSLSNKLLILGLVHTYAK